VLLTDLTMVHTGCTSDLVVGSDVPTEYLF